MRLNAPPSTPTNCVTWPDDPLSWETLLTEAAGSTDPEGDAVTYEYQWRKKDSAGASWGAWGYDGHLLDTSETAKGQIWQARGRACDDLDCSGWCKSSPVTIQNSPPSVPGNCLIAPSDPRTTDDLTATTSGSSDWDADPVTYEYQWRKKDNVTAPWGPFGYDGQTLDHSETAKGQIWHARVRAYDGEAYSDGWRTAPIAFTILNTPPSITGVTISPVNPTTYDDLTATPQGWSDPDADAPGYVWHWQEEETGWTDIPGGTSATLGHENFQPGDHIRVVCTPHDGEQSGEARRRAVTIWIGPTLSWLGGPGYVTDAVHPDRDRHMEWFTFKLRYQGVAVAFVRLHLFRYGVEVAGSPYDMNPGSGDPVTGQTFWFKRRLCKGTYAYYFTASDGAQQAAGPPTRERIGPISHNRPPRLEWAGYGAWEWDPVDRQGRNMPHTQFTWKVKYIDREGDPPEYVRLRLARRSMVGGSPVDEELAASPFEMVAESTDYMNGAVFTYTRQLHAESRYVCWFEAREVAPAPFTSNDAYGVPTWWRRNMVWIFNAPPRLRWAPGANFRGDDPPDGLHPNRGNVGDTFTFKVQYRDPEGVEPAYVRLHLLRWNGSDYVEVGASPFEMSTMGTSFDIANYSVAVQRNQPGRYRYYFSANDGLRDAIGEPSWHRMPGPTVNAAHSASAQITSVSCCPAAGGAQVTFTLSAEACVTAEVLNIAGRVVRVLTADRTMPPGVNALTWNGRDSGGLGVPSGAYLVRMKVVDTAGANVQLVAPVRIAR